MNILATPFNYYPNAAAGGEVYMHNLLKGLQRCGHNVKVICNTKDHYIYDGMMCIPQGKMEHIWVDNNDLFQWSDVVFSQLLGNPYGYNKSRQHKKPHVFFAHNTAKSYFIGDYVVYNSYHMASLGLFGAISTTLQPLVPMGTESKGKKVALINCNENKGAYQFFEMAKMLPRIDFVGYLGMYGKQICPPLHNIEWKPNGEIDWSEIGCLVVPSEKESWSQAATEAICHGVPVICSDLPGLRENLSYAGIYIDRNNISLYCEWILKCLRGDRNGLCMHRAKELDPEPRLKVFNEWLIDKIK